MLDFWRRTKFQSYFGVSLGILSWIIPLGVVLSLSAIIFGLVGLWRSSKEDKHVSWIALAAIALGATSRFIYASETNTMTQAAVVIAIISGLITLIILYLKRKEIFNR